MKMEELEKALKTLSRKENIRRSIYDKRIRKEYLLLEQYKDDPRVIEILKGYSRPTNLEVGTVGAYLWGGQQKYFGDIHAACSAIYSSSFNLTSNNENIDYQHHSCSHQIWIYDKYMHKVVKHQDALSSKAYVYIPSFSNSDRTQVYGLKKRDICILKKEGITHVCLLTTKNGKHKIVVPMSPLSDISSFSSYSNSYYNSFHSYDDKKSSCELYIYLYLLLFVFIFITIILLLYIYYYKKISIVYL